MEMHTQNKKNQIGCQINKKPTPTNFLKKIPCFCSISLAKALTKG
jgi:hypothetical protein